MTYILDTHILIWRLLEPRRLSRKIKLIFESEESTFLIPAISILEVQYLKEIGRIQVEIGDLLFAVREQSNFKIIVFDEVVMLESLKLSSTRDPFDRIILAHALVNFTKILTKDRWMKKTAPQLVIS